MSKISTYEVAPVPKLSDKLIGTSVGGEIEDVTYNFTLQELLDVFLPVIPANNLQGILDYGNTATQDINLFGTITTTNLEVTDTANLFITYLNEETHIVGSVFDSADSVGTAGQVLTSTGEGVEWYTLPPIFTPNLQQVLEEGNTANLNIVLDANIEALDVTSETANVTTQLTIQGTVVDYNESAGSAGQVLESTSTGVQWANLPVYSATSPLLFNSATGVFSIQVANSTQNGYLSSADWITFSGKQNAGSYITALTGEATATGPGSVPITLNNASVINKVLTGLNVTGGSISASDSILTAFGKVQSQINGLMGGVQYQGTWDAATNTPTLTSSVGTQGYYYIVSVDGNTNLNGITDWKVGDWAIFSGGVWQKVDNTDSVTSVNGFTGAVSLTTDNIPEGTTNLYFLNSRARAAVSATSPLLYNNTTGVFSIQQASGIQNGFLSSTDWTTFNSKQDYLGGTGLVKSTAGTITYITDNSSNWNTAYNRSLTSAAVTGTGTKTLTLNQQDGGTITASWSDADTGLTSVGLSMPSAFTVSNSPLTSNGTIGVTGAGTTAEYIRGDGSLATFPSIISEAQNLVTEVYNSSGATLTKGTVVYINGGQGNLPTITKALATGDATSAQTYGVVRSDITNMNNGYVVVAGRLGDLDTRDYTPGQQLYLSSTTAGAWTPTKQYAPNHLVYIAIVVRAHPTQGVVEVMIQNGYELDELHNVAAQTPSNNDGIFYNVTSSLWENKSIATVLGYTPQAQLTLTTTGTSGAATLIGATLNIPQYQSVLTNPITGTGTTNTLPKFTGASTIGNSNITDTGSLISLGSNTNISSGALGIGSTALTGYALRIQKTLTGATNSRNLWIDAPIASDVTSVAAMFGTSPTTQAASFTLSTLIHYYANQATFGAGSTVTNQYGFFVDSGLTGATNDYGFFGNLAAGTNIWNLYMNGTANNYMAGSLGIGTTSLTGVNLYINKNITGATTAYGIYNQGTIQSDATTQVFYYRSFASTQAAAFTLGVLNHYTATLASIGAGSSITEQNGFNVDNTIIGATNNYGFRGRIPSGTGRWNLYMDGTAANYLNGSLGIGSTTIGAKLQVNNAATVGTGSTAMSAINPIIFVDNGNAANGSIVIKSHAVGAGNVVGALRFASSPDGANYNYAGIEALSSASSVVETLSFKIPSSNSSAGTSAEIARIDTNGLSIGTQSATAGTALVVGRNNGRGVYLNGTIPSTLTTTARYVNTTAITAAATFTLSNLQHYFAEQGTFGAGSTVTNQFGFFVDNTLTGATNNYGFYGNIPSGANRWNLYMNGTAANYLNGVLTIGTASPNASAQLQIDSTVRGFLPPRMTSAQRTAIASPATGLIVYQTDGVEGLWLRTSTGWVELTVV